MRNAMPRPPPAAAVSRVAANARQRSTLRNATHVAPLATAAGVAATFDAPTHNRATAEAPAAPNPPRTYCIKATRRASAPKAPAMIIITEAPPGALPQTAVVPGNTCKRLRLQPIRQLVAMIAATTA